MAATSASSAFLTFRYLEPGIYMEVNVSKYAFFAELTISVVIPVHNRDGACTLLNCPRRVCLRFYASNLTKETLGLY